MAVAAPDLALGDVDGILLLVIGNQEHALAPPAECRAEALLPDGEQVHRLLPVRRLFLFLLLALPLCASQEEKPTRSITFFLSVPLVDPKWGGRQCRGHVCKACVRDVRGRIGRPQRTDGEGGASWE